MSPKNRNKRNSIFKVCVSVAAFGTLIPSSVLAQDAGVTQESETFSNSRPRVEQDTTTMSYHLKKSHLFRARLERGVTQTAEQEQRIRRLNPELASDSTKMAEERRATFKKIVSADRLPPGQKQALDKWLENGGLEQTLNQFNPSAEEKHQSRNPDGSGTLKEHSKLGYGKGGDEEYHHPHYGKGKLGYGKGKRRFGDDGITSEIEFQEFMSSLSSEEKETFKQMVEEVYGSPYQGKLLKGGKGLHGKGSMNEEELQKMKSIVIHMGGDTDYLKDRIKEEQARQKRKKDIKTELAQSKNSEAKKPVAKKQPPKSNQCGYYKPGKDGELIFVADDDCHLYLTSGTSLKSKKKKSQSKAKAGPTYPVVGGRELSKAKQRAVYSCGSNTSAVKMGKNARGAEEVSIEVWLDKSPSQPVLMMAGMIGDKIIQGPLASFSRIDRESKNQFTVLALSRNVSESPDSTVNQTAMISGKPQLALAIDQSKPISNQLPMVTGFPIYRGEFVSGARAAEVLREEDGEVLRVLNATVSYGGKNIKLVCEEKLSVETLAEHTPHVTRYPSAAALKTAEMKPGDRDSQLDALVSDLKNKGLIPSDSTSITGQSAGEKSKASSAE